MSKIAKRFFKILLLIGFACMLISSYQICLANDIPTDSNEPVFATIFIDFTTEASVFALNNYWILQENELQFIPDQKSQNRFYMNRFTEYFPAKYTLTTNVRWINGNDYANYGLNFKEGIHNYYAFLTNLSGYGILYQNENGKWKIIKKIKHNTRSKTLYDCLKVICDGSTIKCFINEKKVFDIKDHTEPDNVGVGICTDGNVQCGFKDFTIEEVVVKK